VAAGQQQAGEQGEQQVGKSAVEVHRGSEVGTNL
jgi:hypothetical protein